ncbi:MAG TPA: hypothetical protein VLB46_22160 [Pyrinomonadaceae bacterium]|nr:hypothetical protein [Pyrinomonadaceae bacterium]
MLCSVCIRAGVADRREYEPVILNSDAHLSTKLEGELSMRISMPGIIADDQVIVIIFFSQ